MTTHNPGKKEITYSPTDIKLPRDRATINAWARSFYALDPDINRIIHQHALLMTNAYELMEGNFKDNNKFCKEQLKELRLPTLIETIVQEYFTIGEVFLHLELNEKKDKWKSVYIQNPDYVLVKKEIVSNKERVFLRPDENLRRICLSDKSEDIEACKSFPPDLVKSVKKGKNILTDPYYFWYMRHKISSYDIRGNSFLLPLFKMMTNSPDHPEKRQIIKQFLGDIISLEGYVAKDALLMRYLLIAKQLEYWVNDRILATIAKVRNLDGDLPRVRFNQDKLISAINQ